jgi:hypothetical protein
MYLKLKLYIDGRVVSIEDENFDVEEATLEYASEIFMRAAMAHGLMDVKKEEEDDTFEVPEGIPFSFEVGKG